MLLVQKRGEEFCENFKCLKSREREREKYMIDRQIEREKSKI